MISERNKTKGAGFRTKGRALEKRVGQGIDITL